MHFTHSYYHPWAIVCIIVWGYVFVQSFKLFSGWDKNHYYDNQYGRHGDALLGTGTHEC